MDSVDWVALWRHFPALGSRFSFRQGAAQLVVAVLPLRGSFQIRKYRPPFDALLPIELCRFIIFQKF